MSTEFYAALAEHYDALFRVDETALRFLTNHGAVGGARVLDAACGSGAYTRALVDRGVDAFGTDLSDAMIERARSCGLAADRCEVADMLDARDHRAAPFDLVFCIGNSIAHLSSYDHVSRFFASAADALRAAGTLVVQFVDVSDLPVDGEQRLPALQGPGVEFERTYRRVGTDAIRFDARLIVEPTGPDRPASGAPRTADLSQRLLLLSADRIERMLCACGFASVLVYGGFDAGQPRPDSWVRVVVASRAS
ncbi:MAG: class I SAM-dependent methyltransferase [Spirochaetaceae bacterium]|nr:MAG: class I SAM-dependent methyltransferase [Spirochaetaceae bacterium]